MKKYYKSKNNIIPICKFILFQSKIYYYINNFVSNGTFSNSLGHL